MRHDICCKIIREAITQSWSDYWIKHWVYRDPTTTPHIDRKRCKELRGQDCTLNYPPETPLFMRCMKEVEWLCNTGYPRTGEKLSEATQIPNMLELREKIWAYLNRYNLKVNKQVFDDIIHYGFV